MVEGGALFGAYSYAEVKNGVKDYPEINQQSTYTGQDPSKKTAALAERRAKVYKEEIAMMDLAALTYIFHTLAMCAEEGAEAVMMDASTKQINTAFNKAVKIVELKIQSPKFYVVSVSSPGDTLRAPGDVVAYGDSYEEGGIATKITAAVSKTEKKSVTIKNAAVIEHIKATLLGGGPPPPAEKTADPANPEGEPVANSSSAQEPAANPEGEPAANSLNAQEPAAKPEGEPVANSSSAQEPAANSPNAQEPAAKTDETPAAGGETTVPGHGGGWFSPSSDKATYKEVLVAIRDGKPVMPDDANDGVKYGVEDAEEAWKTAAAAFYLLHAWFFRSVARGTFEEHCDRMQPIYDSFEASGCSCAVTDANVLVADEGGFLLDKKTTWAKHAKFPLETVKEHAVVWLHTGAAVQEEKSKDTTAAVQEEKSKDTTAVVQE